MPHYYARRTSFVRRRLAPGGGTRYPSAIRPRPALCALAPLLSLITLRAAAEPKVSAGFNADGSAFASPAARRRPSVAIRADSHWKDWLATNFPDASASWPRACGRSPAPGRAGETWDFIGKGDLDRDGVPTVLAVRVKASPRKGRLIVDELAVEKCAGGAWRTVLKLGGVDVRLHYGDPEDALGPGLVVSAAEADAAGHVFSEDEDYGYIPKLGRYGSNAERERVAEGKKVLKARPRRRAPR